VAHQVLLSAGRPYRLRCATLSIGASAAAVNAQLLCDQSGFRSSAMRVGWAKARCCSTCAASHAQLPTPSRLTAWAKTRQVGASSTGCGRRLCPPYERGRASGSLIFLRIFLRGVGIRWAGSSLRCMRAMAPSDRPTETTYSGQIRAGARKNLAWTMSCRNAIAARSALRRAMDGKDRLHP
jgi:hypothetical protein